jgi:hypothetical protein
MEEEGIWSLVFIFSGLADWVFFLCVDEEKRKKERRREGLGERKKKRHWSATPWVSRVRPGCVDFVGLAMAEWKDDGIWSSGFGRKVAGDGDHGG